VTYQAQGQLFFAAMKGGDAVYGNSQEFAREIAQANTVIRAINAQPLPAAIPWKNARDLFVAADELLRAGAMHTAYQQAENTFFEAPADQARYAGNRAQRAHMRYLGPISNMLKEARPAGEDALVPTSMLQKNIRLAVEEATRTYEALAYLLDIRPGIVRFMDGAVKLYNKVAAAWVAAVKKMKEAIVDPALDALDRFREDIEKLIRWSITATVVGGSAYIIYKISQSRR
jgi:hypothetical protein